MLRIKKIGIEISPEFQVRGAELEICVDVCNCMILMKLCTEIRDAHEGIWGL